MLKWFKRAFLDPVNPVELIKGNNKPSIILVDLVSSKILMNIDNIAYKEELNDVGGGSASFSWKVDEIIVAGSKTYSFRTEYVASMGQHYNIREKHKDKFDIIPQIKVHGKAHSLTQEEQKRLWDNLVHAGRLKLQRDKELAEYRRQQDAVQAIANMGDRESDIVTRAKQLSEQAMLRIAAPSKTPEELLAERFGE